MLRLRRFTISMTTILAALALVACEAVSATTLAGTATAPESTEADSVTATEPGPVIATDALPTTTVAPAATNTPSVDELRRRQDPTAYSILATIEADRSGAHVSSYATVSAPPAPESPKTYLVAAADQLVGFEQILFESQPYVDSDGSEGQQLRLERYSDQNRIQESVYLDLKIAVNVASASEGFATCNAMDVLPGNSLTSLDLLVPATDSVSGWLLTPDDNRDWTTVILCAQKDVAVLRVVVAAPSSAEVIGVLSGRASNLAQAVAESLSER